jgi:hypothetical protein
VRRSIAPFTRGHPRRRHPLLTARLNAVGWLAVGLACLGAGAAGAVLARLTGWSRGWSALLGASCVPVALVIADRRRWGQMTTSYSWTDDLAEVERGAASLRRAGVRVDVENDDESGPRLRYRNRDAGRVRTVLAAAGVVVPRR